MEGFINELERFDYRVKPTNDSEVFNMMNQRIDDYIKMISVYYPDITKKLECIRKLLNDTVNYFFAGDISSANCEIDKLYELYIDDIYIHDLHEGNSITIYKDAYKNLYRGRVGNWNTSMRRRDLLHIPFTSRNLISTQRFSINGVPCIYLGQSIYVIWDEIGRPSNDNLFISRFEISEDLRVLDLGLSTFEIKDTFYDIDCIKEEVDEKLFKTYLEKFIVNNILKIACLVKVDSEKESFRSEYIIPQLLLARGLIGNYIDGVRYPSVKISSESYIFCNYAFPAILDKSYPGNGEMYSYKITSQMKLTQPINLGILSKLSRKITIGRLMSDNLYRDHTYVEFSKDYYVSYSSTEFYEIEGELKNENTFKLEYVDES